MTLTANSTDSSDRLLDLAEELLQQTVIENEFIPDSLHGYTFPSPKQALFLTAPVNEILYGGAAGGGKSAAILAAALQYVEEPGYDALIVRRSYADLEKPGGLIQMSQHWLADKDCNYNPQTHRWTFASGATLSFGHIQNEASVIQDYQGSAFAFVGFDELTQFTEFMYRYLFSRIRKAIGLTFPTRARATANPGGLGHEWVKRRFIDGADGILRLFIPAKLEDNPGLNKAEYEESLAVLDHVTRQQLRHGDWDVRPEGKMFKRAWFKDKIVEQVPRDLQWVRYWDLAATKKQDDNDPDWASGCKMGMSTDGRFFIAGMEHFRENPRMVEANVTTTAQIDGIGVSIRIEQEPGSASKLYIDSLASDALKAYDVRGVPSVTDKQTRARPFSAACEHGNVFLIRGAWVEPFLDELCAFPSVVHDDQVDGATGAFRQLTGGLDNWTEDDLKEVVAYEDH